MFGCLDSMMYICKLFKQYCRSFYGVSLWFLSSHIVNKACTAWRKAVRKMWRPSPMTHCDVITLISDCILLEVSLQLRFCKFSSNILKYGSNVVKTVANVALKEIHYLPIVIIFKKLLISVYNLILMNVIV